MVPRNIFNFIESHTIHLLIFFSSLFILVSFAGTRLFLSDEGVILDQFYNLINGSLALRIAKIDTARGLFILVGNDLYGRFSYSLLILSLPVYYILRSIDVILRSIDVMYGAHLFILLLWALSGGVIVYLLTRTMKLRHSELQGGLAFIILITTNLYFFKPIYFPKWGELLSIEFTNILLTSFLVLLIYLLFKDLFGNKIAVFASFFVIFATPISFYAVTLKHHSLTIFLTVLSFYFFHKYQEKKDNWLIYAAYVSAGLCIWTRILDGAVLLASLLISDIIILRRRVKDIIPVSIIILISLIPFFSFNYLILGNPFSIIEMVPVIDNPVTLFGARDFISLNDNPANNKQVELLNELGYRWGTESNDNWLRIIINIMFSRSINAFGVFLVSPFLIAALIFAIMWAKHKIKLNKMDGFLILYGVLSVSVYVNYFMAITSDTPMVLEYRYLLILYIILFYFALRIDIIRELIESNLRKIAITSAIVSIAALVFFIVEFPVPFMNIYNYAALITSISLITVITIWKKRSALQEKLIIFMVALALAEASSLLLFYYWVVSMTYISPSQNLTILPVLENILKWMYQVIL